MIAAVLWLQAYGIPKGEKASLEVYESICQICEATEYPLSVQMISIEPQGLWCVVLIGPVGMPSLPQREIQAILEEAEAYSVTPPPDQIAGLVDKFIAVLIEAVERGEGSVKRSYRGEDQ